jgi:hypothetical protein
MPALAAPAAPSATTLELMMTPICSPRDDADDISAARAGHRRVGLRLDTKVALKCADSGRCEAITASTGCWRTVRDAARQGDLRTTLRRRSSRKLPRTGLREISQTTSCLRLFAELGPARGHFSST